MMWECIGGRYDGRLVGVADGAECVKFARLDGGEDVYTVADGSLQRAVPTGYLFGRPIFERPTDEIIRGD